MLTLPTDSAVVDTLQQNGTTIAEIEQSFTTEVPDSEVAEHDKESYTNGLIGDLAWILVLGAIATLLFQKLKQPVVLGYIRAGFLASPKFV